MNLNRCINDGLVVGDDGFCPNCNAYYSQWNTRDNPPAPKSRREKVEVELGKVWAYRSPEEVPIHLNQIARTLADEVDERGAVITKLLAMLEPGVSPPKSHTSCDCVECRCHKINEERHARACEIAGRKE